jgi:hypothetical protein
VRQVSLFSALIDDAAMFPPGNAPAARAVAEHADYRRSWFAPLIGPLVVPDSALTDVGRHVGHLDPTPSSPTPSSPTPFSGRARLPVSVINSGGAGGLLALARRSVADVEVVAVESALRDFDDLGGNAERVAAAADELDPSVTVFVEIPYTVGWLRAVEVIEAAGLQGKIRTGGTEPELYPSAEQLAEQLSVLVEADLSFKATAGLHRAWPNLARNDRGQELHQHGFLSVMMALDALIDGAEPTDAAELLRIVEPQRIGLAVSSWDEATQQRIRRRLRSFGCCGVTDPVADLVAMGLLSEPT